MPKPKSSSVQKYEKDPYTKRQNRLYKECLYGLSIYKGEELFSLSVHEKTLIKNNNEKTQRLLNLFKQQVIIHYSNLFFNKYFPDSRITRDLLSDDNCKPKTNVACKFTFADLDITKEDIIEILIANNVLPKDFYQ